MDEEFLKKERQRFRRRFKSAHRDGFKSPDDFALWCVNKLREQDGKCAYCETSITLIQKIVEKSRATPEPVIFHQLRRVRGEGFRGSTLEIEKRNPNLGYNPDNCALICYFCNNDKSSLYTEKDYREFFGPNRKRHFITLADRLDIKL